MITIYKNKKIIRIVLDERYNIQYASIDDKNAIEHLKILKVLCRLSDELPIKYNIKDYYVTIDKISSRENIINRDFSTTDIINTNNFFLQLLETIN